MTTKRDRERSRFPMRVGLSKHLEPLMPWVEESMQHYAFGSEVEVQVYKRRSQKHLAKYWCILAECVANKDNQYGSDEDLHKALKVALGYTHKIKRIGEGPGAVLLRSAAYCLNKLSVLLEPPIPGITDWMIKLYKIIDQLQEHIGDTIILPGSVAFDSMDQAEFNVYYERAMNELRKAGYPIDDYEKVAEQKLKPYYGDNYYGSGKRSRQRDSGTKKESA